MMDKKLQVAIVLNALDNMSGPAEAAVARTIRATGRLQNSNISMGQAAVLSAAGYSVLRGEMGLIDKYTDQQAADTQVRIREMNNLGKVNEAAYGGEIDLSKRLSAQYSKSIEDYDAMISTLRRNRIQPDDIIGGIGETTAQLSLAFGDLDPNKGALFFARLKNDLHVATGDMGKLANMAYKLFQVGVGENSEDAVTQLTEAYSKAGLGALNLGMHGAKDAEDLGILMGTFIAKGLSGQTVGNNFRRIFDGMLDPKRMAKVNAAAAQVGLKLDFFDEKGQFKGIENFRKELGKLKGLAPQTIGGILQPFSGKQGLSVDFLENMSKFGGDADALKDQYNNAADLTGAIKELTKTLKIQRAVLSTNVDNMEAAFGKSMQGDVGKVIGLLNEMTLSATNFAGSEPGISRIALEFAGIAGSAGAITGSLALIGRIIPGIAASAGTIGLAFLGIGMAAEVFKEFVEWGDHRAEKEIKTNPTGDRERLMAGYDKIIADPATGFFKRNAARAVKAGLGANIALFGDDPAHPEVDPSKDTKQTVIDDLKKHRQSETDRRNALWDTEKYPDKSKWPWLPEVDAPAFSSYKKVATSAEMPGGPAPDLTREWLDNFNKVNNTSYSAPTPSIGTYAPVFNFASTGDSLADFKRAAKENADYLFTLLQGKDNRKNQLSYGNN